MFHDFVSDHTRLPQLYPFTAHCSIYAHFIWGPVSSVGSDVMATESSFRVPAFSKPPDEKALNFGSVILGRN